MEDNRSPLLLCARFYTLWSQAQYMDETKSYLDHHPIKSISLVKVLKNSEKICWQALNKKVLHWSSSPLAMREL
jgi:hypothetical protein